MNFISIFCKINMRIFIMAKFDPAVTFSNNFMRLPLESPAGEANNHYPGKYQRCDTTKLYLYIIQTPDKNIPDYFFFLQLMF